MRPRRLLPLPERPELPLLSALLTALAFPPFRLLLPSFVALAPLAVWLARLPGGPGGRREALRGGLLAGLALHSLLLYWVATALARFSTLAVPAFLFPVLLLAGLTALAVLGIHQASTRLGLPVWAGLPLFWTGLEWLRGHLGPLAFPWLGLGDSLAAFPRLAGAADLVGSRGLGAWLALCSGLVAEIVLRWRPGWLEPLLPEGRTASPGGRRRGSPALPAAALALLVALPIGYSAWRWSALELRPAARVAVLQPDVSQEVKRRGAPAVDSAAASVRRLLAGGLEEQRPLDLVVLPETAFPAVLPTGPARGEAREVERFVGAVAGRLGAPVLYGAQGAAAGSGRPGGRHNSAFLGGEGGARLGVYHKRRLVPVVERSWPGMGGFLPGPPRPDLLPAGASRFGVLVCWEAIFPGLARSYRLRGADFLVNVTNDAWFGRGGSAWRRTSALWQHPAHLVMRAIENRMGAVRAANTGLSMTVDPLGRVRHRTPLFEPAAFTARVSTTGDTTFFARHGDLLGWACALASLGVTLASGLGRQRHRRRSGDGGET